MRPSTWVSQSQADVPDRDGWLGERERIVLAAMRFRPRRDSWRLGRWTAKLALSAWLGTSPERIEVLAAADGAPAVWLGHAGEPLPLSLSLSHRAGRAIALVADAPTAVGCDLELLERRSDAFVLEWLSPPERRFVAACERERCHPALAANLVWTAKEAAAKVRRGGLRLDVRGAAVTVGGAIHRIGAWQPLEVAWGDGHRTIAGWWRAEAGWVIAVAAEPAAGPPAPMNEIASVAE